jgi:chromosome segregation ATPase
MVDARGASLLAHASELDRRDQMLAGEIAVLDELATDVGALRAQAARVLEALQALPGERATAEAAEADARGALARARQALAVAEARLAELERARRSRQDDVDQARRERTRAGEDVHDASARVERIVARRAELDDLGRALDAEAEGLTVEARSVAARIGSNGRVADAGSVEPGTSLDQLERWGAQARASLFVARSALATERERVVVEANTLGSAVLGEPLGASSAAVVRRRIEQALGAS